MTPERWKKLDALFHEALKFQGEARAALLAKACGTDEQLREEAERLIAADERQSSFIDLPIFEQSAEPANDDRIKSPVGRCIGPYQIISQLGRGGMGEVYRAQDTRLGREVAVKLLPAAFSTDQERLRRFEQEARAAGMLNHPNVLTIYDIGTAATENGSAPYIVSELLTGETLRERMRKEALPLRRAIDYALQIARGLAAAHEKEIVHRDLKPENLFITKDGRVKILDFGLAKLKLPPVSPMIGAMNGMETIASPQPLGTAPGVVMGTVGYMSPEQVRAEEVDYRSDIFAFGAILYEMLYGRRAFPGGSAVEVLNAILREEPPEIAESGREVPPALTSVMRHCLEKDRAERFQSIGDVAFYLDALLGTTDSTARSQSQAADRPKSYWRPGWLGWIVAAALLLTAATLLILYSRRQPGGLPAQATIKQLTNYTGTETAGALSPDGRHFAFVSEKGGAPDIWVRQVSGGDPQQVTRDEAVESDLVYAPDGETIYYVSERDIWRIGALGGTPRKVVQGARSPSLSSDGKRLAYVKLIPEGSNRGAIEIANADGSSPVRFHEGYRIGEVSLSPDNRWIAYSEGSSFEPRPLKLIDLRSRETRVVPTTTKGGIWSQAWLPDSRRLVISREYDPGPMTSMVLDLELVSIDGDEPRRLTLNVNSRFSSPRLSADGKRLLVTMSESQREIWTVPLGADPKANGAAARRLLDSSWDPLYTFVSRDGGTILFNSLATGNSNIYTMPADGSIPPRQITEFPGYKVMCSSLSPDGTRIAYSSLQTGNPEIWVMNIDGSNPVQVTHDPAEDLWPTWSPDGSWLMWWSRRGGVDQLLKGPVGGSQAVKVSDGGSLGDWLGDRLVFSAQGSVIVAEARTGNVLRKIPGRESGRTMPVWSPDGRRFTVIRSDHYLRDSIWIFDAGTGDHSLAVEFPGRFHMIFRADWGKDAKSLIVNRNETVSHIGLLENF
jgi:eukaryotic-like serine/threonine-protein kinase